MKANIGHKVDANQTPSKFLLIHSQNFVACDAIGARNTWFRFNYNRFMLYRIRHQCGSLLRLPFPSLNPSTLILTKSSSLISAESLELEPSTTSPATNGSVKATGSSGVKFLGVKRWFETLVSGPNSSQVDEIINYLQTHDPDSAVELFDLLKNEYGFRHSRSSQFVIAHLLASQRQLKALRSNFMQMLQEEGKNSKLFHRTSSSYLDL